jgi:molybdenum cofactor guanylyltransferase
MPPDHLPTSAARLRRVVVLAGGDSRRLGRDKLAADLGGRTVLAALLDGLGSFVPGVDVVLVGPPERSTTGARVVQEDPPGGGPVAGLAAGLAADLVGPSAADPAAKLQDDDLVAVLAGDQPFAAAALPLLAAATAPGGALGGALGGAVDGALGGAVDGALGVDADGRDQPLLAVYRTGPLRRALAELADESGLVGARVRDVVTRLRLARVVLPETAALDVDTAQDLERARAVVRHRLTPPGP